MGTAGVLASWVAITFGVWTFGSALISTGYHPSARASAERALLASGLAALIASAILITLLLAGNVTVSYVARSVATNVPATYRMAALLSFPAGAVLPTAAIVAGFGAFATRGARSPLGLATVGATVVALLASSVSGAPFAILPWLPADGLGMAPTLQHPASVLGRIALSLGVATSASAAAIAADALADDSPHALDRVAYTRWLLATAALISATLFSAALGSFATGGAFTPAPLALWNRALVPALVAIICAYRARGGSAEAALLGALGVLGLASSVLIGAGSLSRGGVPLTVFVLASLGASVYGAIAAIIRRQRGVGRLLSVVGVVALAVGAVVAVRASAPPAVWMPQLAQWLLIGGGVATGLSVAAADCEIRRSRALALTLAGAVFGAAFGLWLAHGALSTASGWGALAGTSLGVMVGALRGAAPAGLSSTDRQWRVGIGCAIAFAALAACGESVPTTSSLTLVSGGQGSVALRLSGAVRLAHQGLSRYESVNSHVIAIALEASGGPVDGRLIIVERREYVDSRDEALGGPITRPGVTSGLLEELRVTLEDVGREEQVSLRVVAVPLAMAWRVALLVLALTAIIVCCPPLHRLARPDRDSLVRP